MCPRRLAEPGPSDFWPIFSIASAKMRFVIIQRSEEVLGRGAGRIISQKALSSCKDCGTPNGEQIGGWGVCPTGKSDLVRLRCDAKLCGRARGHHVPGARALWDHLMPVLSLFIVSKVVPMVVPVVLMVVPVVLFPVLGPCGTI